MNNEMGRERASKFYQAHLDNPNLSVDKIIEEVYKNLGKTPEEIEKYIQEYHDYVNEINSLGLKGNDAIEEMKKQNDEIEQISLNENGNMNINIQKGAPKFGGITIPSSPVSSNPSDIKFGDNEQAVAPSTITPNNSNIAFGNEEILTIVDDSMNEEMNIDFPNAVKPVSNENISPQNGTGLTIEGQEPKQENIRTDNFQFGDESTNTPQNPSEGDLGTPGGSGPKL